MKSAAKKLWKYIEGINGLLLILIPVFAYNFGTTILLTGIDDATRFFFYTYLLIPLMLVFIYFNFTERKESIGYFKATE